MIRALLLLTLLGLLASCGADGMPSAPPAPVAASPTVTTSGTVSAGIAINGTGS